MVWLSFTTDYGLADGFVAACHGVVARIVPSARVLDVSHAVPPRQVRAGAQLLAQTVPYLPEGCLHLAVVDPGVGTQRGGVVVVAERGLLVGPDNGLLVPAAEVLGGIRACYELVEPRFRLPAVSATFHGRDIFAPAAAHLALGVSPAEFGPPVDNLVRLPDPLIRNEIGRIVSDVLTVDHFGNVQLAATESHLETARLNGNVTIYCGRFELAAAAGRTFADVPAGKAVLFTDSAGQLAVAVNNGSAADALGIAGYSSAQRCTITASPTAS